ncbi:MAG: sensor histidine kinase, partial [Bacteroidia bacterium]|nr:sensor histidine kinase [Bacteroidia bacterium]
NMSLKIRTESGDKLGISVSLNNIGAVYNSLEKLDLALDYYTQSMKRSEEIGNKNGIANALNNIGRVFDKRGQYDKALDYFERAMKIYEEIKDNPKVSTSLGNIGGIYMKQKQNAKALQYITRALDICIKGNNVEGIRNTYMLLTRVDSTMGNTTAAFDHYKKYVMYRDSMINTVTRKAAIKKQLQYEYDKKEEASKIEQEKKEILNQEELKRQKLINMVNFSAIGALVLALLSALLLFNRARLKQKNKHQQLLNQKQKEQAVAVMETQEQERKRIAEDIHDSLGHLLSTTKLNLQTLPEGQKQIENSLSLLNQASEEIRNITFNLMPRALEEEGLVAALNELANKITNTGTVKVALHVHDFERFVLDKQSQFNIYRIVQEAVNNILKHAEAKEISIQLIGQKDHLTIMIEDDGKGFDTTTKQSGRGLKNIVTRSLWLNGNINIDSTPGRGTTITTEIPT